MTDEIVHLMKKMGDLLHWRSSSLSNLIRFSEAGDCEMNLHCRMEQFIKNAVYDDYDRLVQLGDALALPTGFCMLEKRFVDVTIRYGVHPATVDRWKKILEIKDLFEKEIGCSIYNLLPGVIENSLSLEPNSVRIINKNRSSNKSDCFQR